MTQRTTITRRNFFSKASAAGIALGAPAILKSGTLNSPSDDIRVGFIGCGKQHEVLYQSMLNIPGIRFVAACDLMRADRLQKTHALIARAFGTRIATYTDAEEMLTKESGNMDAVFIATPDFWHAPHTIMALESGCHVYCEKMMSNTLEGARSMVAAMERTGKLCQIGHQRRSNPRYLYVLNELIRKQRICGQITNVNAQWNRSLAASTDITHGNPEIMPDAQTLRHYGFGAGAATLLTEHELRHRFLNWRWYQALSGGPISDLGAHQIDIFNWFLGTTPKSVVASGGRSYFKDREHLDNVMCIFDYDSPEGNIRAFYQVLTTTSAGGGYYESFMGTEGTVAISERESYTNIYKEASGEGAKWKRLVAQGYLIKAAGAAPSDDGSAIAAYESAPPDKYALPGGLGLNPEKEQEADEEDKPQNRAKPPHQPHIENFFDAIRGKAQLTCDARHALESEAPIYWINEAATTGNPITFTHQHLHT